MRERYTEVVLNWGVNEIVSGVHPVPLIITFFTFRPLDFDLIYFQLSFIILIFYKQIKNI